MNDPDGVDGVTPTLAYIAKQLLRDLRKWAAAKAAGYGMDVKRQVIRGAAYGLGSGAVSILVFYFRTRI